MVPSSPYGPVQDGEDDVDGGQQLTGALSQGQQLTAATRIGRQGQLRCPTRRSPSGSWPSVMARVSGRASVSTQEPSGEMPTATHFEPLRIEVAQDAAGGNARDGVFRAASAVDNGDADSGSHNLERLPSTLGRALAATA